MAINKVILNGVTKVDLTADTVTADKVLEGLTFHDATGSLCTGTMKQSTGSVGAGDITLYTKLAYTYDEYVNNSSSGAEVVNYYENGSHRNNPCYLVVNTDGRVDAAFTNYYDVYVPMDGSIYACDTEKIISVDVNFGGGCGS